MRSAHATPWNVAVRRGPPCPAFARPCHPGDGHHRGVRGGDGTSRPGREYSVRPVRLILSPAPRPDRRPLPEATDTWLWWCRTARSSTPSATKRGRICSGSVSSERSGRTSGRLRRIDLLDPGADRAAELATTLVDHYLHWRSDVKYRRLLDTDPNSADPAHRRFHDLLRDVWPGRYDGAGGTDTGPVPVATRRRCGLRLPHLPRLRPLPRPSRSRNTARTPLRPTGDSRSRTSSGSPAVSRPDRHPSPTRAGPRRRSGGNSRPRTCGPPLGSRARRRSRSRRQRGKRRGVPRRGRTAHSKRRTDGPRKPRARAGPSRPCGGNGPPTEYRRGPSPTMDTQGRRPRRPRIRHRRARPLSSTQEWTRPPPVALRVTARVSPRSRDGGRSPTG